MEQHFLLHIKDKETLQLARAWLFLGIAALLASGIFSLLLVLSRTPFIQNLLPYKDFFHTAIVVHVDLSVLIWFTAFAAGLWSIACKKVIMLDWLAFYLGLIGTVVLVVTPFIVDGNPIMNNYIPVLQTPLFYTALGLYGIAILIRILHSLLEPQFNPLNALFTSKNSDNEKVLHWGMYLAAITTLSAMLALVFTWIKLPLNIPEAAYFEVLFWGSGHILQFNHLLMVLVVWLILLHCHCNSMNFSSRAVAVLFLLTFVPVLFSLFPYIQYPILSAELHQSFTQLMKYGGLASIPLGSMIVYGLLFCNRDRGTASPAFYALWSSLILFTVGGALGFMIDGANVVIPAHYHGSIVGITIAFMGCSYYLLPQFGYPLSTKALKWANRQPVVYTIGQMMHISGLAWSGGYGVKRKTAGDAQGLENLPEIAGMALMGLGGLIAVIGGFLFLLICYWAIAKK